jgi:hypothetical protein
MPFESGPGGPVKGMTIEPYYAGVPPDGVFFHQEYGVPMTRMSMDTAAAAAAFNQNRFIVWKIGMILRGFPWLTF